MCKQQRHTPFCTSVQAGQGLSYLHISFFISKKWSDVKDSLFGLHKCTALTGLHVTVYNWAEGSFCMSHP